MAQRIKPPNAGALAHRDKRKTEGPRSGNRLGSLRDPVAALACPSERPWGVLAKTVGEQPIHTGPRMALLIRCSGSAFPAITDDGGKDQRGRIMRCRASKRMLQHADGSRRRLTKATATNGISFGGEEGTMTVAKKMIRRIKTVEGNADNRADRASSRFQLRQPRADVPTSNGVSLFGSEVAEKTRHRSTGGSDHAELPERNLGSPCATISNDVGTNARRTSGRFLARHLIASGSDRLFAGRRGARVQNTRCPGREFFGLAVFSSLRSGNE